LEANKCVLSGFGTEQKKVFSVPESSKLSLCSDPNINISMDEEDDSQSEEDSRKSSTTSARLSTLRPRTPTQRSASSEEYVVIKPSNPAKKMRLTQHQKEKMAEKSDSLLCVTEESQSIDFAARLPPGYIAREIKLRRVVILLEDCLKAKKLHGVEIPMQNTASDTHDFKQVVETECENNSEIVEEKFETKIDKQPNEENLAVLTDHSALPQVTADTASSSTENITPQDKASVLPESVASDPIADGLPKTPNSILKNSESVATCPSLSEKKTRRVRFDESVLDNPDRPPLDIYYRSKKSLFFNLQGKQNVNKAPVSPPKQAAVLPVNKDPDKALFPFSVQLKVEMTSRGVTTIGDMALLSAHDIDTFTFRLPKLKQYLRVLNDHHRTRRGGVIFSASRNRLAGRQLLTHAVGESVAL
uniref:CDT1 domain-containing protein n=1 Tax=Gongylonema pulchrum TaxID=637853 RepID=A0A183DYG7_9BILA